MNHLKQIMLFFILSNHAMNENIATPTRSPRQTSPGHLFCTPEAHQANSQAIEETPLKQATRKQAELFNKANFQEALGEENWQLLLKKMQTTSINPSEQDLLESFENFENISDLADKSSKRQNFKTILMYFKNCQSPRDDNKFKKINEKLLELSYEIDKIPEIWVKNHTIEYFSELFKINENDIKIVNKKDGVQVGCIANIISEKFKGKYYVKFHSNGWRYNDSRTKASGTSAKETNILELLSYSILAHIGVGPEVHFFGRDWNNLLIATKDLSADNPFCEYDKLEKIKQEQGEAHDVWNSRVNQHIDSFHNDEIKNYVKSIYNLPKLQIKEVIIGGEFKDIATDKTSEQFEKIDLIKPLMKQFCLLNVLAKFMRLKDLCSNPGNFGFEFSDDGPKLKILDFRMNNEISQPKKGDYDNFANGNPGNNFNSTLVEYSLNNRHSQFKIKDIKEIMNETPIENILSFLTSMQEEVDKLIHNQQITITNNSVKYIYNLLQKSFCNQSEDNKNVKNKLKAFYNAIINIKGNINSFQEALNSDENMDVESN